MIPKSTHSGWTAVVGLTVLVSGFISGCFDERMPHVDGPASHLAAPGAKGTAAQAAVLPPIDETDLGPFQLKPEWAGPCQRAEAVDVNLGNAPDVFVRAASCQVTGHEPTAEATTTWVERLKKAKTKTRRIDVVLSLCKENNRTCQLAYSNPWTNDPELVGASAKSSKRDVGAVCMFFFSCPNDTNCKMDWANTHAQGMAEKAPLLGFGAEKTGYYVPSQPGFWRHELLDAQYAGLDFLLLNTYGPDIEEGKLKPLTQALDSIKDPIKIGMFDDTWTWGQTYFSKAWTKKPDLNDTDAAAKQIYEMKWKPFFTQVDKSHWYRFNGKPFIFFYNAGTLLPRGRSSALIAKLKQLFAADFGEEPFVDVDEAFFEDSNMEHVADSRFSWFTFNSPLKRNRSKLNGHVIDNAMVKWDSVGRDHPGVLPLGTDLIIKDGTLLTRILNETQDSEVLILATWNDLGEGTGINRNYDYYFHGQWQRPDYFMQVLRKARSAQ